MAASEVPPQAPVAAADAQAGRAAEERTRSAPAAAPAPMTKPAPPIGLRGLGADVRSSALSPELAQHVTDLESQGPEAWRERIASLRRDGRTAEADGLLAEFRRRFPAETEPR